MDAAEVPAEKVVPSPPERLGVALSGGGFRASFFHLGVFARLAELGVLRHVSVISTVSGGSIVGAFYYLHLKTLLETNAKPTDDDYRNLVHDLQDEFLTGVRKNIRGRILLNPYKNYRMVLDRKYSRSDRIGDLYDRYLYKKAWGDPGKRLRVQIQLRWLVMKPKEYEGKEPFNPWYHNKDLAAKVPILIMNSTSLNTGHNWRFEAVRMGEPAPDDSHAAELLHEIDVNERLKQAYFEPRPDERQVPEAQRAFPLAKAVAASACVPLLFHPLSVSDMYGGRRVQLVDGGVYDNQGVQALFDTECDAAIISDASGLMADRLKPAPFALAVAPRSMSIYGARVRIEQLVRAKAKPAYALMHLLSGVPAGTVEAGARLEVPPAEPLTKYGINRDVQIHLARVRTDLDAFTDAEAYTLMYSGYRMSASEIDQWVVGCEAARAVVKPAPVDPAAWCFGPVAGLADVPQPPPRYMRVLAAGRSLFFKSLLSLPRPAALAAAAVLAAVAVAAVFGIVWGALHGTFDLGGWSNWWWLAVILFIPALLSITALLQLLGGLLYLRIGRAANLPH